MSVQGNFPFYKSKLDLRQEIYTNNRKEWQKVLRIFNENLKATGSEGNAISTQRHQDREQLLARDRVALLLDPDSPFLELAQFAGHGLDSTPCASIVAGIGLINGRACMIICSIPSIKGGAWNEFTVLKHNRMTEIANENELPIVGLVQAAGVFLPQQFRVFHKASQMFKDLARRSASRLPSCSVVFGSSTAGGAYLPGLSDYTIFVKNKAQVFLGGPPLVKMATGEIVDAETLGGGDMHASVTGLADQLAIDEFDAIRKAREWVKTLPERSQRLESLNEPLSPRYPAEDLLALVNPDIRKPFDMAEIVLRLVDGSRLSTFKPNYGKNLLTCWAEIHGHATGIIGNQTPVINPDEASKGAQFIRLCNQRDMPIIYLHNVTGFMVGSTAEQAGIIKKGAQFVSAVSCSKVPQISVILGSSYGAGNYAMCGRGYNPRFLFTWPIGRCSVMGPSQLAGVMETVLTTGASAQSKAQNGQAVGGQSANTDVFRDNVERESESYYTSAHLLDDGVIDPRDTRDILGMCLEIVKIPKVEGAVGHRSLARL
ncbi:hypothetical protein LTR84_004738 [Exophiala bonariae]|uniref:methylcrotonoyl-CoA carboxylase n=1 Tax=Exophiala bonariae TaxID=1690606 RepID=A0AAV9NN93_9EURO|nr:hypothetical protein LTR84_004738 [Exophiala bonariae]